MYVSMGRQRPTEEYEPCSRPATPLASPCSYWAPPAPDTRPPARATPTQRRTGGSAGALSRAPPARGSTRALRGACPAASLRPARAHGLRNVTQYVREVAGKEGRTEEVPQDDVRLLECGGVRALHERRPLNRAQEQELLVRHRWLHPDYRR